MPSSHSGRICLGSKPTKMGVLFILHLSHKFVFMTEILRKYRFSSKKYHRLRHNVVDIYSLCMALQCFWQAVIIFIWKHIQNKYSFSIISNLVLWVPKGIFHFDMMLCQGQIWLSISKKVLPPHQSCTARRTKEPWPSNTFHINMKVAPRDHVVSI